MFSVKYNKISNEMLDVQSELIEIPEDTELAVKIFEGDKPDMTTVAWSPEILNFVPRINDTISKITFRRRFTFEQQMAVDEFNDTYMNLEYLTREQKNLIRTGLNNYKETPDVTMTDPFIPILLDLYISVGIIAEIDKNRILKGS